MTLETAKIRAQVAHEIGVRLDDALEAARGETVRWEGSNQGLLMGQKAILGLLPHVDRDIEEGKYDLQTATAVKLYINRCAQVCANMAVQSSTQRAMSQGQIQMGEANVKVLKKFHEEELRRVEAIAAAEAESRAAGKLAGEEESVDLRSRPAGVHPPASIKQQRLAEEAEAVQAAAKATEAVAAQAKAVEAAAVEAKAAEVKAAEAAAEASRVAKAAEEASVAKAAAEAAKAAEAVKAAAEAAEIEIARVAWEARVAEARAEEARAELVRIAESRLAESRLAEARAEEARLAEVRAEEARVAEAKAEEDKPSWTLEQIGLLVKDEPAPVFRKKPGPKPKTSALSPALSPALAPSRKKPGPKPKPKT